MTIYRVHIRGANARSLEYRYFPSKSDAKAYLRNNTAVEWDGSDFEKLDVPITKRGILQVLNTYASHPDNGL